MATHRHVLWLVLAAVIFDYSFVTMMRVCLPFHAKALGGSSTMIPDSMPRDCLSCIALVLLPQPLAIATLNPKP